MKEVAIALPSDVDCAKLIRVIDDALAKSGLDVSLRASLKKFPGCTHWHVKDGQQSGTLEITVWPKERRAWFTIQSGRKAAWINDKLKMLDGIIQRSLRDS